MSILIRIIFGIVVASASDLLFQTTDAIVITTTAIRMPVITIVIFLIVSCSILVFDFSHNRNYIRRKGL